MVRVYPHSQWDDKGGYKEPVDDDNIRVPRLEVDDATTYIDKDGSDNMTLTDAVTGTKTLADLNGSGDVDGPGSSTDNAIVRYHETTGKIIQDYTSGAPTIGDTGIIQLNAFLDINLEHLNNVGTIEMVNAQLLQWKDTGGTLRNVLVLGGDDNIYFTNTAASGSLIFRTTTNAGAGSVGLRLTINGNLATAVAAWTNVTHTGIVASGDISLSGGNITCVSTETVDGRDVSVDGSKLDGVATGAVDAAGAVSAVEAAGLTFAENKGIILDPALSANGKWSGIVEVGTAGASLGFGDIVYLAVADSKWELTDADAEATAFGKVGICVMSAIENNLTTILLYGKVRADALFPTLTIGAPVYIGTTAGDVQVAAPSGSGDIVRIIGYGNTADELFFCPDNSYVELA